MKGVMPVGPGTAAPDPNSPYVKTRGSYPLENTRMTSLSDYRWDRAVRRLRQRYEDANKVWAITDNYEAMQRLKHQAMADYLEEVPELRELKRQAKLEGKNA